MDCDAALCVKIFCRGGWSRWWGAKSLVSESRWGNYANFDVASSCSICSDAGSRPLPSSAALQIPVGLGCKPHLAYGPLAVRAAATCLGYGARAAAAADAARPLSSSTAPDLDSLSLDERLAVSLGAWPVTRTSGSRPGSGATALGAASCRTPRRGSQRFRVQRSWEGQKTRIAPFVCSARERGSW